MYDKYVIGVKRNLPQVDDSKLKESSNVTSSSHIEECKLDGSDLPEKSTNLSRAGTARQKFNRHWRRFWCCYLLASIIFLAIFLPVFFLVAIPAIAQRIVDDTNLPIYSAEILDPTTSTVSFLLHTSLKIPMGLKIHTDAFNLSLFNRDVTPMQPYLTAELPTYSLKGNTKMTITQNDTSILNQSQFIDTLTQAVYQKKFTMSAKGSTVGHLGALNTPLTLDKDVELDGLDKLSGFSIDSAQLVIPKRADGTNIIGTATLPNHSVFTFALGNVTLNLRSSDLVVGQATIENVILRPGNNTVALSGEVDISTILDNLEEIISDQKAALLNGDIELSASGNSTIYNGVHIQYYEDVLNNLTLTTRVPILEVLSGTLQQLLDEDNNSTIANLVQNITSILGDVNSSGTDSVAMSLKNLV